MNKRHPRSKELNYPMASLAMLVPQPKPLFPLRAVLDLWCDPSQLGADSPFHFLLFFFPFTAKVTRERALQLFCIRPPSPFHWLSLMNHPVFTLNS